MKSFFTVCLCGLVWTAAALGAKPGISSNFEGGSIGKCQTVARNHISCAVKGETNRDGRNRQATWYYFRVDSTAGQELTIDLTGLAGEYNFRRNKGGITDKTPPWISYDQKSWDYVRARKYDVSRPRLRIRITPEKDTFWLAHLPPYTTRNFAALMADIGGHKHLWKEVIGRSVEGRDLVLLTVTDPAVPAARKKVIWLMFRQHAWEAGSSWAADGALRFLLSRQGRAPYLRRKLIFKFLPMCDPDGVARGGVRFNNDGYDLNRNWDKIDPKRMPEIAAQHQVIADWLAAGHPIHLFLTIHNTETAEYLDGSPEGAPARQVNSCFRLFHALQNATNFAPSRRPRSQQTSTVLDRPGSMTVTQGLYHEFKIPAFLMELAITTNLKLRHPRTIEDWKNLGRRMLPYLQPAVAY